MALAAGWDLDAVVRNEAFGEVGRRSVGEGAAMGLFYSIPNPHPPGDG